MNTLIRKTTSATGSKRPHWWLVALVVLGLVAIGGGTWAISNSGTAGAPPDQAGLWSVWAPDDDVEDDVNLLTGWNDHYLVMTLGLVGPLPEETQERVDRLLPSLMMNIDVVAGETPGITSIQAMLNCGETILQAEEFQFNHPQMINDDGTVEVDLGFVSWEGKFSASEEFSGSWTSGECGGSWTVGDADETSNGGWVAESDLDED